jgi:hypothetical protein
MWWTGPMKSPQPLKNYCNPHEIFSQEMRQGQLIMILIKFEARNTKFETISKFKFSKHVLVFSI